MPSHITQANLINGGLLYYNSGNPVLAGSYASEMPFTQDNINDGLTRLQQPLGVWNSHESDLDEVYTQLNVASGCWNQNSDSPDGRNTPVRPVGAFHIRLVSFANEITRFGYVASITGGMLNAKVGITPMASTVDYEPIYGHGVTSWPLPWTSIASQFRDSANLPSDGASAISSTGSAFNRSQRLHPCMFLFHIVQGGTIQSGNIRFVLEQRPTFNMTHGTNGIYDASCGSFGGPHPSDIVGPTTSLRSLAVHLTRFFYGNSWNQGTTNGDWGVFVYQMDPTTWENTTVEESYESPNVLADFPLLRDPDPRIREHAVFPLTDSYFGITNGSLVCIFSTKTYGAPVRTWDMGDRWASSAYKRIAGIAPDQTSLDIWVLSESGDLVLVDASTSGCLRVVKTAAPALGSGERYGAMVKIGTKLWAIVGQWAGKPSDTTTNGALVGLIPYDTSTDLWGARVNSTLPARHNTRCLGELRALKDGRLAMLVEKVSDSAGNVSNIGSPNTCVWQLLIYDPSLDAWNTTSLSAANAIFYTVMAGPPGWWNGGQNLWFQLPNATMFETSNNRILIQGNHYNDKVFVYDCSGALTDAQFKNVSFGQPLSIFPIGQDVSNATVFLKNTLDNSVVTRCGTEYMNSYLSNGPNHRNYLAHDGFVWDGSERMQYAPANAFSGNVTSSVAKDCHFSGGSSNDIVQQWRYPIAPVIYSDTQLHMLSAGRGWAQNTNLMTLYMPRYFKWTGSAWVKAKNFADAELGAYPVPAAPGTSIQLPYGLVVSFGPIGNTTFTTNEYHTFSLSSGQVKFSRRARYAYTQFAGHTFQDVNTKSLTDVQALKVGMWVQPSVCNISATGPSGITPVSGYPLSFAWPIVFNGTINDAPVVVTLDTTTLPLGFPICTTTPTASSTHWNWTYEWSHASGEWARWDLGAGNQKTVLWYSLTRYTTNAQATKSWKLQGSNDASDSPTNWVDLHTVTNHVWPAQANSCQSAARYPVSSPGAYRHYRFLTTDTAAGYFRLANVAMYDEAMPTDLSFSDICFGNNSLVYTGDNQLLIPTFSCGLKFEINHTASPDTAGFTEITPLYRSHNGYFFCFNRQTGVRQIRITSQYGMYQDASNRWFPPFFAVDYPSQAIMNAARLGLSTAADNTATRGSFDSECLGIAADTINVSVDGANFQSISPAYLSRPEAQLGWFKRMDPPTDTLFKAHPFYGFVRLGPGVTGSSVTLTYAWGRRV